MLPYCWVIGPQQPDIRDVNGIVTSGFKRTGKSRRQLRIDQESHAYVDRMTG